MMAQGILFSLYISIGAKCKIHRKPAKEGYVQLNIERSYYKLTLKASEHIPLRTNHASKLLIFVFFFFTSCNSRTKRAIGVLLGRNYWKVTELYSLIELVVKAIIFSIKVFMAHSDTALQKPPCHLFEKLPLVQRAEVRVCLVKCKIGIRLTKSGAPWNSC